MNRVRKKCVSHGGVGGDYDSRAGRRRAVARPKRRPDFSGILELAAVLNALHRQQATVYAPLVKDTIRSRCRDQQQIEQLLDRLLDCACIPEGLALFKSLCRYYYTFNPTVTANYVGYYREMWDNEA